MKKPLNITIGEQDKELIKDKADSVRETIGQYLVKSALMRAGELKE